MNLVRRFFSKQLILFFVATALIVNPFLTVYALSEDIEEIYSQGDLLFYDPSCKENETSQPSYNSKPKGEDITWIGDSYSVGAEAKIKEKFGNVSFDSNPKNIQSSKRFSYDINGNSADTSGKRNISSDNPSGLTILKERVDKGHVKDYIVFALGTNDGGIKKAETEKWLKELKKLATKNRKVVLVTAKTNNGGDYKEVNQAYKDFVKDNSNFYLADWAKAVKDKLDSSFGSDNIHPNDAGYTLWVDTIYDALPGGGASLIEGNSNKAKIWNYFVGANIEKVSDNPAAISGIMGNIQGESDFDPFAQLDTMWGLFQTDNESFHKKIKEKGWEKYLHPSGTKSTAPQDVQDEAIQFELDFFHTKFWRWSDLFVPNLKSIKKNTADEWAEYGVITLEGAITGTVSEETTLEYSNMRDLGLKLFKNSYGETTSTHYQGVKKRRNFALEIYKEYGSGKNSGKKGETSYLPTGSAYAEGDNIKWNKGWISGMPGIQKDDVTNKSDLSETVPQKYPSGMPNKILLHSTEGTSVGYQAYPAGNKFPAHFIVDLKKKEGFQNLSISRPALAIKSHDDQAIQIEIVGFSATKNSPYYLQKFTAAEWDYLVVLLNAISEETGIPLTTEVSWSGSNIRINNAEKFKKTKGVVGHMHAHNNDHSDPGNIWKYIEKAIKRNPSTAQFADNDPNNPEDNNPSSNSYCDDGESDSDSDTDSDNIPGGNSIAATAVNFAWPDISSGKCKTSSGSEVDFNSKKSECYSTPTEAYSKAHKKHGIGGSMLDCGHFVASVIHDTGLDKNFPKSGSGNMRDHMKSSKLWEQIKNPTKEKLQPGDIMSYDGHIEIYVGEEGGKYGSIASASQGDYVGILKSFRIERKGETASVFRIKSTSSGNATLKDGGMTLSEAKNFMKPYHDKAMEFGTGIQTVLGTSVTYDAGCKKGTLNNCSAFSNWFINKYTSASGVPVIQGSKTVSRLLSDYPTHFKNGKKVPAVYAIVSLGPTTGTSDGWYNHTAVVLGIDKKADKIILGEASCNFSYEPHALEYSLSKYTNNPSVYAPTYAYPTKLKGLSK